MYSVLYLRSDGSVERESVLACDSDDEAIDRAGESGHSHGIEVRRNGVTIARFPPLNWLTRR